MLSLSILALSSPVPTTVESSAVSEWEAWKAKHGKLYSSNAEHDLRQRIWMQTAWPGPRLLSSGHRRPLRRSNMWLRCRSMCLLAVASLRTLAACG